MDKGKKNKGAAWRNPAIPALEVNKFLRSELVSNKEKRILRSENEVIERLLQADLKSVWTSLLQQIPDPWQWRVVVSRIVTVPEREGVAVTDRPQTTRDQAIEALIVDAHMAAQELQRVLERGDVYRAHACLKATHRRAIADLALGCWFLRNSVRGVGRYLRACWIVGWRRGWKR